MIITLNLVSSVLNSPALYLPRGSDFSSEGPAVPKNSRMRASTKRQSAVFRLLVCAAVVPLLFSSPSTAQVTTKPHAIFLLLDESKSMRQSDPERLRIEAVSLLSSLGTERDILGVAAFGDSPRWIISPSNGFSKRTSEVQSTLSRLTSPDDHTDFASAIGFIGQYLGQQPRDFFSAYEVSLILLTDGKADPAPGKYDSNGNAANRADAESEMSKLPSRTVVYTIGLGPAVETAFLQTLARSTGGLSVSSPSSAGLSESFLKIATRIYGLPAYQATDANASLSFEGGPSTGRAVIVLFKATDQSSAQIDDALLLMESKHIMALQVAGVHKPLTVKSRGGGRVVLCIQQPLQFETQVPMPAAQLTGGMIPVKVRLIASSEPVWGTLFLKDAYVQLHVHSDSEDYVFPLKANEADKSFTSTISMQVPGEYQAYVELLSPYGAVTTFLGNTEIAGSAVSMPTSIKVGVPPTENMGWLTPTRFESKFLLPSGAADVVFQVPSGVRVEPTSAHLQPGSIVRFSVWSNGSTATVAVPVTITWNDGRDAQKTTVTLSADVTTISWVEVAKRRRWETLTALIALLLITWAVRRRIRPPLRGRLVIDYRGVRTADLDLRRLRTKSLEIRETVASSEQTKSWLGIPTGADRKLATLTYKRVGKKNRWKRVLKPHTTLYVDDRPLTEEAIPEGQPVSLKDKDLKIIVY